MDEQDETIIITLVRRLLPSHDMSDEVAACMLEFIEHGEPKSKNLVQHHGTVVDLIYSIRVLPECHDKERCWAAMKRLNEGAEQRFADLMEGAVFGELGAITTLGQGVACYPLPDSMMRYLAAATNTPTPQGSTQSPK